MLPYFIYFLPWLTISLVSETLLRMLSTPARKKNTVYHAKHPIGRKMDDNECVHVGAPRRSSGDFKTTFGLAGFMLKVICRCDVIARSSLVLSFGNAATVSWSEGW